MNPVCLIVMDGWGIGPGDAGDAIARANTPTYDHLLAEYPHAALSASGESVGLPDGQMGNSEVGHLTLGAGNAVPQTLTLIDHQVASGALTGNEVIREALTASARVHLLGMVSDGGVHSSLAHLEAIIDLAAELGVEDLVLHCITDGRDTPPRSGAGFLRASSSAAAGPAPDASPTSPVATTRWTATAAGSAPRPPMTCSSTAAPSTGPRTRRPRSRPPTTAGRPTSSSSRPRSGPRAGSGPATACCASTSGPTGCARSSARSPSPASARATSHCPDGAAATGRPRSGGSRR